MANPATDSRYKVAIGIECHVQLNTQTKLFSAANNDAREAAPNTQISHIDFGMPGALPVLNRQAIQLAIRAAFGLGTSPQPFSSFDRKHYFYPDLPSGYQITQFYHPIIKNGSVKFILEGKEHTVRIHEAHLEADAGKNTHPAGKDYSLVDLNRSGTPLLEIVSEPDMHSPEEAKAYARELYLIARFAGISDANLYYGNMRFDVNVSVSKTNALGTRTETKNLNSFKSVEKAAEYEIDRQIELLENGKPIIQETRGWDEAKQKTISQRGKEEAHDYRYMPDPDLPPVELSSKDIQAVAATMPMLPAQWREKLSGLEIEPGHIETLLEAQMDFQPVEFLDEIACWLEDKPRAVALVNWFVNVEIPLRANEENTVQQNNNERRSELYQATYDLVREKKLSSTNAKLLISTVLLSGAEPKNYEKYASEQGLIQQSDVSELSGIVATVIKENPDAVNDVQNGEHKAIGFLVRQVMKASHGQANPAVSQELIKKQLGL